MRDSAAHVEAWRTRLTDAQQRALRQGWEAMDPPWYRGDDAW
jgi:hypothetical protein